jgi:hypothetical protein
MVRDIADAACVNAAIEEHQYVAIDRRAADCAALDVASRLRQFPKRRHATRLYHEENKAAERNIIARRLRHAGSGWGGISGVDHAIAFARCRNETRPLRLMPTLQVNSGTGKQRPPEGGLCCASLLTERDIFPWRANASALPLCPTEGEPTGYSVYWPSGFGFRGGWRGKAWLAIRWRAYAASKWCQLERQLILGQRLYHQSGHRSIGLVDRIQARADGGAWMRCARIGNSHGQPALARRLLARRGHPLFDPGGGLGLPRLAQKPFALAHALSSGRFRPQSLGVFGYLRFGDLVWHFRGPCTTRSKYLAGGSGQQGTNS